MKKKIQLGIIGKNFGYNVLYKSLLNNNQVNINSFCIRSKSNSINLPNEIKIYEDWQKLIDDKNIDAVLIVTPPFLHQKIISYAIKKNKHVFCEKPCGISPSEVEKIINQITKKKIFLSHMVNYEIGELAAFKYFRKVIASKKINYGSLDWIIYNKSKKKNWKTEHKKGGGILFNYYCHTLYYLEKLLGKISSIKCKIKDSHRNLDKFLKGDIIFASGLKIKVKLLIGKKKIHKKGTHKLILKTNKFRYELKSSTKKINDQFIIKKYFHNKNSIDLFKEKKSIKDFRINPSLFNLSRFVKSIKKRKVNKPSFFDALQVQRLIEKTIISSKKNKRISIN